MYRPIPRNHAGLDFNKPDGLPRARVDELGQRFCPSPPLGDARAICVSAPAISMKPMTDMTENASPLLTIVESLEPDRVVVKLIGLADSTSSVVLEREFLRLNALRAALVVFDLSQLTFISSLAIGLLVSFRKGQSRHGGKALLEGVTGSVAEALQRTRVTELFV